MNPVVHFEMPAKDRDRMTTFYTKTFGWKAHAYGPDMGNYTVVQTGETDENGMAKRPGFINGGFFPIMKDSKVPMVVIAVDDIKKHVELVKKAGGKILKESMDIPGIGSYVNFTDTEGNKVAMLQPLMK